MISYEDEKEIIGNEVIVPFLIREENGESEIEAYKAVRTAVEDLIIYKNINCFSKKGIDRIDEALLPYVKSLGYEREICGKYRWYLSYEARSAEDISQDIITDGTVKLSRAHLKLANRTTFDLSELIEKRLEAFVVIREGAVVSIAAVNEHYKGQKMLEITVETAVGYRNNGYASSAAAALALLLIQKGKSVAYVCSRYNRSSIKTAQKAGFKYVGRFYAYTAYKLL